MPVYTLGLGSEEEIESNDLRRLAVSTRGQYYPARNADQLRAIYEQIAERLNSSYTLMYQSDRKIPDGTLRPVRIVYRGSSKSAGETAVFIPGMVVPSGGWSPLFLGLLRRSHRADFSAGSAGRSKSNCLSQITAHRLSHVGLARGYSEVPLSFRLKCNISDVHLLINCAAHSLQPMAGSSEAFTVVLGKSAVPCSLGHASFKLADRLCSG